MIQQTSVPPTLRLPLCFHWQSDRGDAGNVFEELLLGGTIAVLCAFSLKKKTAPTIHVVFRPANGPFRNHECRSAPRSKESILPCHSMLLLLNLTLALACPLLLLVLNGRLTPQFFADFVKAPRRVGPKDYAPFPAGTIFLDPVELSGHVHETDSALLARGFGSYQRRSRSRGMHASTDLSLQTCCSAGRRRPQF